MRRGLCPRRACVVRGAPLRVWLCVWLSCVSLLWGAAWCVRGLIPGTARCVALWAALGAAAQLLSLAMCALRVAVCVCDGCRGAWE